MVDTQQGDVYLFQTDDDGEINVTGGIVEMNGGLETAAYLSLFGGNENDNGLDQNENEWWGNISEVQPSRKYRSETQNLLRSIPATSGNLRRLEDSASRDLAWFVQENVASSVTIVATIPELNTLKLTVNINAEGRESNFEFIENWKVSI